MAFLAVLDNENSIARNEFVYTSEKVTSQSPKQTCIQEIKRIHYERNRFENRRTSKRRLVLSLKVKISLQLLR